MTNYVSEIEKELSAQPDGDALLEACAPVLQSEEFAHYPAAVFKHHAYYGGLAQHTLEVLKLSLDFVQRVPSADRRVIAVAAVWHDFGKLHDYRLGFVDHDECHIGSIEYTSEASLVGHLTMSAALFYQFGEKQLREGKTLPVSRKHLMEMNHAIVAHHGRKEWGSPREPQTIEAMAVHYADCMSVMQNTGLNTSARKERLIRPLTAYRVEDLDIGDLVVASGTYAGVQQDEVQYKLHSISKNGIPVCMPMVGTKGNLVKIPAKSILYVIPSEP